MCMEMFCRTSTQRVAHSECYTKSGMHVCMTIFIKLGTMTTHPSRHMQSSTPGIPNLYLSQLFQLLIILNTQTTIVHTQRNLINKCIQIYTKSNVLKVTMSHSYVSHTLAMKPAQLGQVMYHHAQQTYRAIDESNQPIMQ